MKIGSRVAIDWLQDRRKRHEPCNSYRVLGARDLDLAQFLGDRYVSYLQSHRSGKSASLTMWAQAHAATSGCNNGNDRRRNKPYLDESACAAVDFAAGRSLPWSSKA